MFEPELVDMIELAGNVEVWQDVEELSAEGDQSAFPSFRAHIADLTHPPLFLAPVVPGLDDIEELLARADEPGDSAYPWCQAHFLACCKATGETPPTAKKADPSEPEFQYITAIVEFRTSLSHLLRCPARIRLSLSEDLCELYFNEEDPGPGGKKRIGLDLMVAPSGEEALQKLIHMSDLGIRKVMNRLEDLLLRDIIPSYFRAYNECGAREDLVYPEEQVCIERNYPKKPEEEESDEDDVYQLDVIILKAENLKVMDADTGMSDPFVKVTLGDESFFTNVRRQTLNPYWGETAGHFKFEVDQEERKKMRLKVAIYDDDDDGEAFIGQCKFAVNDLKKDGPYTDDLYDLLDEKGNPDPSLGQVYLKIRFGAPRDDDDQDLDDLIYAPKLCKPTYPLTLGAVQRAATMIANARRVQLACQEVSGYMQVKGEAGEVMEISAKKIQRMWRTKMMWRKIMNFRKAMTGGGEFLKYSRKGVPNMTHVYCPPTLDSIHWKQVGAYLGGDHISVTEVKAVVLGRMTKSFLLHDQGKSQPAAKVNASFSIVTRDRSLDLECAGKPEEGLTPERERSNWLDNFAFLLKDQLKESALMLLRH